MPSSSASARLGRPGRRTAAGEPRSPRHGLEAFAPKGALLLQVLANGDQLVIADALVEPRPVGLGAYQPRIPHFEKAGVGCHH